MVNRVAASKGEFEQKTLLNDFIVYMKNYSDNSVYNYSYTVKRFLQQTKIDPKNINDYIIRSFCQEYSQGATYLKYLKLFGKFLYEKAIIDERILFRIKFLSLKSPPKQYKPKIIKKEGWKNIFRKIHGPAKLAVYIQLQFGLRIGEVCNLLITDVNLEEKILSIQPHNGWKPKSLNSIRDLPISNSQEKVLEKYLSIRKEKKLQHEYLIYNPSTRKRFEENRLMGWYKNYLHLRSHDLRKSSATHLFNTTLERENAKDLLGHKDIRTTELYLGITNEEKITRLREAQEKAGL